MVTTDGCMVPSSHDVTTSLSKNNVNSDTATLCPHYTCEGGLATGWRTASGKEVEAGMKGFWYQYKNIFSLLEELELPEWPLTDWTTSGFWSPRGLVTEAPVFSKLPRLPTLVGQFVHTFPLYWQVHSIFH